MLEKNVNLIDIRQDPIQEITNVGLETESQKLDFDMIIFATGFDALTGSLLKMDATQFIKARALSESDDESTDSSVG